MTREDRLAEVLRLYHEGASVAESAEHLSMTTGAVARARRALRDAGDIPPITKCPLELAGVQYGAMKPLIKSLPLEVRAWIADEIPDGATLAEFAVACLFDSYQDAQEVDQ